MASPIPQQAHSTETAAQAAAAVAEAVRHNLTSPGSVTPAEQLRLTFADRAAHNLPAAAYPAGATGPTVTGPTATGPTAT